MCLVCPQRRGQAPTAEIDHPPGEEIQWDWLQLTVTPWGSPRSSSSARVALRTVPRGVLRADDVRVLRRRDARGARRLGRHDPGMAHRPDGDIVVPGTDRLNPQFAQLAKYYGVDVAICPPHRPQRKGVVEAAIKFIGGRWWRTARAGLDAGRAAVPRHVRASPSPTSVLGVGAPSANSARRSRCRDCRRWRSRPRSSSTGSRRAARWFYSRRTSTASRPATPASH